MDDHRTALTDRITLAEDWLARARRQVEDGEQARGVLTLLLAEAEVHRAREVCVGASHMPPRAKSLRTPLAALAAAGVILAAVALWRPFGPAASLRAEAGEGTPFRIVSLAAGTGSLLTLVQAQDASEERVVLVTAPASVQKTIVKIAVPGPATIAGAPGKRGAQVPQAGAKSSAPGHSASVAVLAPPAVPSGTVESSPLLSEAELIDLVLAAERSLRRPSNQ